MVSSLVYYYFISRQEDVDLWNGKEVDELPEHLQFFCKEFDNSDYMNRRIKKRE